jgi:hypothetical protein
VPEVRVCNDRFRASCSCATLLCVGARDGIGGNGSVERARSLRSTDDLDFRGGEYDVLSPK